MNFLVIRGHAICLRDTDGERRHPHRSRQTLEGHAVHMPNEPRITNHEINRLKPEKSVKSLTDQRYSTSVRKVRDRAMALARSLGNADVTGEHLVLALAIEPEGRKALVKFEYDADLTRKAAVKCVARIAQETHLAEGNVGKRECFEKIMDAAVTHAGEREPELRAASLDDLIFAILSVSEAVAARDLIRGRGMEQDGNVLAAEVQNARKSSEAALEEIRRLNGRMVELASTLSAVGKAVLSPTVAPPSMFNLWRSTPVAVARAPMAVAANDNIMSRSPRIVRMVAGTLLLCVGFAVGYMLRESGTVFGKISGWLAFIFV